MDRLETMESRQEPRIWWHWQNLNDKKDGTHGGGLRHGRCWWHFRTAPPKHHKTIEFCWNLWSHFCGIEFDISDEDVTLMVAFPPFAFWLSFSCNWRPIEKLVPCKLLDPVTYPGVIVIDERECGIRIHSGKLWIKPWGKRGEWARADPWWVRGVTFNLNPFEWHHMRHEARRADGSWVPFVGCWEIGPVRGKGIGGYLGGKEADGREELAYPYRYVLKDGTVQDRTATVYVERRAWRPKCLRWTSLIEKVRTSIDIVFSGEVGERTGSWKGGTIGCGWDLLPGETPESALRRMERERKF